MTVFSKNSQAGASTGNKSFMPFTPAIFWTFALLGLTPCELVWDWFIVGPDIPKNYALVDEAAE